MKMTCKKCKKNYKVLVNSVCFFCDTKAWFTYFEKQRGKGK